MPQIQFRFEFNDYVHAQMLHGRRTPFLKVAQFLSRRIAPPVGILMVVFAFSRIVIHGLSAVGAELPVSLFITLGVGTSLTIYRPLVRLNWSLCYERTRSNNGEGTFEFSDETIRTQTSNAKSEIEWSAIRSFLEDKKTFLLYSAPAMFFPIPKRACTDEQVSELRSLFQRRIQPATK